MKVFIPFSALMVLVSTNASLLLPRIVEHHIIQGEDAVPHAAPYIVSLSSLENGTHICGGTIIAKDWIVTAAHCVAQPISGMGAIAGLHKRNVFDEFTQHRVVDFGMVHELYSSGVGPYDIAILHVSESFEYTQFVQAALLPALGQIPSGNVTLYGWGQTKGLLPTVSKTLQTAVMEILDWNECKEHLPETANLAESNICSDSFGTSISPCNGDSGGPLVKEVLGAPAELIGIVSWGYIPCGFAKMPSIYTRVSAYMDWVVKIMNAYYTIMR